MLTKVIKGAVLTACKAAVDGECANLRSPDPAVTSNTFAKAPKVAPPRPAQHHLDRTPFPTPHRDMVSVCGTCQGLQRQLKALESSQETENDTLQWVDATLPRLRTSAGNCRACALLLNGILLHHERFAGISEERIRVKAESFPSEPGRTFQDHLSVELRWKEQDAHHDECQDDEHGHVGYPDLKLEFFTDGGGCCASKFPSQSSFQIC
jgi:hypothetical protein